MAGASAGGAVEGHADRRFTATRDALTELVVSGAEAGAAVAVAVDGRLVVDLWGGTRDDGGRPWEATTIVNAYSVGKPLAAACVLRLVEIGAITLDEPACRSWPAFAAAGKDGITVRQVLAHQAGLDLFEQPLDAGLLLDWDAGVELLAAAAPRWPPGSSHGEHALFYGHLVGELVRRVDGRSLGAFFREELAGPWALDVAFGLDDAGLARAADVVDPGGAFARSIRRHGRLYRLALENPPGLLDPAVVNGEPWRRAEIPAVNAHATARGVARFYAGLAAGGTLDGVPLLSPGLVAEAVGSPQLRGRDEVLGRDVGWGLGPQVDAEGFGMGGLGGNVGLWSQDRYAFAYVTRLLGSHDRADALENAVRAGLGLPPLDDAGD